MTPIWIRGAGAVSPAGWGLAAFRNALDARHPLPVTCLEGPNPQRTLPCRTVPAATPRPPLFAHPRLRRASSISLFAAAAAQEALHQANPAWPRNSPTLGIVFCSMCGGIRYTRRFYAEVLQDPSTASPLLFPETVFNAPASHLSALFNVPGRNDTLIGDSTVVLEGLALAAQWLLDGTTEDCLVVAAEELDWAVADAWHFFSRHTVVAEGAAALLLSRSPGPLPLAQLERVTEPVLYLHRDPLEATRETRNQLPAPSPQDLLVDDRTGLSRTDQVIDAAWANWPGSRLSPKQILGEGLAAGTAWQCLAALDALRQTATPSATVAATGCNLQAAAARFLRAPP